MKKILFVTLMFCSFTTYSNDFSAPEKKDGLHTAFQSQEMRNQICEFFESPFSEDNIGAVYKEIKSTLAKEDWAYEPLAKVNMKLIKDVKSRCKDKMNLELFSHSVCKETCTDEFNNKVAGKVAGYFSGKQERLNLCIKACDAALITYNASIRALKPMYIKMNTLKAENPKCYSQVEVLDSRKEKYMESISGKLYEIIDLKNVPK